MVAVGESNPNKMALSMSNSKSALAQPTIHRELKAGPVSNHEYVD